MPVDHRYVSYVDASARIAELRDLVVRSAAPLAPDELASDGGAPGSQPSFAGTLAALAPAAAGGTAGGVDVEALIAQLRAAAPGSLLDALLQPAPAWLTGATSSGSGQQLVDLARLEVGQREEPPGSNDGPRIAEYRSAVVGSYAGGAWCAYFVSWLARQAGAPIGDGGTGEGAVEGIERWAAASGRLLPADVQPQPGDVILYGGDHVGVVESVNADGSLTTIEGNHHNAVERVQRARAEATGFVRI